MVQMTTVTEGFESGHAARLGKILNVSYAVGRGLHNWSEDVMLVQVLLNRACGGDRPAESPFSWVAAMPALVPDGIFGPITRSWILAYQGDPTFCVAVQCDGRVDPCRGSVRSAITGTVYTIYMLNAHTYLRDPKLLSELHLDPAVPLPLRQKVAALVAAERAGT
jgi:hypothetical protein